MDKETLFELIIMSALAVCFLVMGIFLWQGKGAWMIAGYNTSTKQEQKKYDTKALCRFVAKLLWLTTALLVVICFAKNSLTVICLSLVYIIFIFGAVIYANTGNRFKKK